MKFKQLALVIGIAALLLYSCDSSGPGPGSSLLSDNVTVGVDGMMSVTSMSKWPANINFSYVQASSSIPAQRNLSMEKLRAAGGKLKLKDHPSAAKFNANPPAFNKLNKARSLMSEPPVYSLGDSRDFWIENNLNPGNFIPFTAKLREIRESCMIWVADGDYTGLSTKIAEMADMFDDIYPKETNLLGYEYGGGPSGDGGIDGEKRIQILVYDINDGIDTSTEGTILGYFWAKDEFYQDELDDAFLFNKLKSNEAEIFYIDSEYFKIEPDTIYSTLIHEFQHMIHFNQKAIIRNQLSDTWYNEMLSQLAEDVIGPMVGIDIDSPGHVINERIPLFLDVYDWLGLEDWDGGFSYSISYAFGAFLLRNFGGPVLMKEMLSNNKVDHDSVTAALQTINSGYSFNYALERYAEALIYSHSAKSPYGLPAGKCSFDKTTSNVIGGKTYTAKAFDIWEIECYWPGDRDDWKDYSGYYWLKKTGPWIWRMRNNFTIYSHSVSLQHNQFGKRMNVTGDYAWLRAYGN